jgi:hypothetical protein
MVPLFNRKVFPPTIVNLPCALFVQDADQPNSDAKDFSSEAHAKLVHKDKPTVVRISEAATSFRTGRPRSKPLCERRRSSQAPS